MKLPGYISLCIRMLEDAGFAAYAVGGCVRDSMLGLVPHDYDLCTAATPEQLRGIFAGYPLVLSGEKHGTVSVVMEHRLVEITTFRTEGGYRDSRHPDWVRFETNIEADLSRRDFTVNAMAFSPTRGFADPFGGGEDLKNKILCAVGDPDTRFTEDALRILRGVRFSVRYGLTVEPRTLDAMFRLAPLMDKLARERVMDELTKLLPHMTAEDLLGFAPILTQVIPELAPCVGFAQHSPHHLYDVYAHTAHTVAAMPPDPALRLAALLHDIGKPAAFTLDEQGCGHFYGHAESGADMANAVLLRLKASNELRHRVTEMIRHHMIPLAADKKLLRRRLNQYGPQGLQDQLAMQLADRIGTGTGSTEELTQACAVLKELLAENACFQLKDLAINGHDLMALGFRGPAIGKCLSALLEQVIDERIPNERNALLNAAKKQT